MKLLPTISDWSEEVLQRTARCSNLILGVLIVFIFLIALYVVSRMPPAVGLIVLSLAVMPVCIGIIPTFYCLSREILNLRKRVEDLEKKKNS